MKSDEFWKKVTHKESPLWSKNNVHEKFVKEFYASFQNEAISSSFRLIEIQKKSFAELKSIDKPAPCQVLRLFKRDSKD